MQLSAVLLFLITAVQGFWSASLVAWLWRFIASKLFMLASLEIKIKKLLKLVKVQAENSIKSTGKLAISKRVKFLDIFSQTLVKRPSMIYDFV